MVVTAMTTLWTPACLGNPAAHDHLVNIYELNKANLGSTTQFSLFSFLPSTSQLMLFGGQLAVFCSQICSQP